MGELDRHKCDARCPGVPTLSRFEFQYVGTYLLSGHFCNNHQCPFTCDTRLSTACAFRKVARYTALLEQYQKPTLCGMSSEHYPQRTLKDGLLYLSGRSDEDDGFLVGKTSVRSVVDTTTDPSRHFIGRRMQNNVLDPNRHKNFIIERHAGIRYCWIGLRTSAYAARVRSRIPLWDSGPLSPK